MQVTHWIVAHSLRHNEEKRVYERGGYVSFRADQIACYKPTSQGIGGTRILFIGGEYIEIFGSMQSLQSMLLKISMENRTSVHSDGNMKEHMLGE